MTANDTNDTNENDTATDTASAETEPLPPTDDPKEQMRRALEAKHHRHGTSAAGTSPTNAAKADSHAQGKSQRTFRRKSG
jgi:hypothetical protein